MIHKAVDVRLGEIFRKENNFGIGESECSTDAQQASREVRILMKFAEEICKNEW